MSDDELIDEKLHLISVNESIKLTEISSVSNAKNLNSDFTDTLLCIHDQTDINTFIMMMRLWTEEAEIFCEQYQALLQILQSLQNISSIKQLLKDLITLKKRCKAQFLILSVCQVQILIASLLQMSTLFFTEKQLVMSITNLMYFQNFIALITHFMKSFKFWQQTYIEMINIVNTSTELWHLQSWKSSIKYSFKQFSQYSYIKESVFLSDFVYYKCITAVCICHHTEQSKHEKKHLDKVLFIERECQTNASSQNAMMLELQSILHHSSNNYDDQLNHLSSLFNMCKIITIDNQQSFILKS